MTHVQSYDIRIKLDIDKVRVVKVKRYQFYLIKGSFSCQGRIRGRLPQGVQSSFKSSNRMYVDDAVVFTFDSFQF